MTFSSFSCPPERLARLFHAGREGWKQRAAAKQKEIRYLRVKVRDLAASREFWKQRALQDRTARADAATPSSTSPTHLGG